MPKQAIVPALSSLVPMAHVASVERSIEFYQRIGFQVHNAFTPPDETEPNFAFLRSGGADLMVVRAGAAAGARQAIVLMLYCADVLGFHAALRQQGVRVEDITYPPETPRGRFRLTDPDGYDLAATHT